MRGTVATPVIIKVAQSRLTQLTGHLLSDYNFLGLSIPLFDMVAAVLPNEVIDEVKQLDFVETIFLDREMRIPEIRGALITSDPVRHLLVRAVEVRPLKAVTSPKSKWTPTSETRKIIEADIAGIEGYEGRNVKVGIVDTDSSPRYRAHPQLRGRVTGHTVIDEASDKCGHGGHVTTTSIGGEFTDRIFLLSAYGVAPKASGIGVKVLRGPEGMGNTSDVIKGVEYAVNWGAQVINLSLGGPPTKDPTEDPMYHAFEQIKDRVITCAAAGNSGPNPGTMGAPGSLPNVLSVAAINPKDGSLASFSSRGPTPDGRIKPDVAAPGVEIWSGITAETYLDYISDLLGNGFSALSGTSMATPHVTGLMALVVELFKRELPQVPLTTDLVFKTCEEYGETKNNDRGWGLIRWSWFKRYVEEHK